MSRDYPDRAVWLAKRATPRKQPKKFAYIAVERKPGLDEQGNEVMGTWSYGPYRKPKVEK